MGRQRPVHASNSAVPRRQPTAAGGAGARRQGAPSANAAAGARGDAAITAPVPEGGRVHLPIGKGHPPRVRPTLAEALRGGVKRRAAAGSRCARALSTTCADKTFETHVGPFSQPASIHSPFPVRGRRPQLRRVCGLADGREKAANCGGIPPVPRSRAYRMYVNADKMFRFGASDAVLRHRCSRSRSTSGGAAQGASDAIFSAFLVAVQLAGPIKISPRTEEPEGTANRPLLVSYRPLVSACARRF